MKVNIDEITEPLKEEAAKLQDSVNDISEVIVNYLAIRTAISVLIKKYGEEYQDGRGEGWGEACGEHRDDLESILKGLIK